MGSVGSGGILIFGVFSRPVVPFAYNFSIRASLGVNLYWLSLDGPLGMLVIGGIIFSTPWLLRKI